MKPYTPRKKGVKVDPKLAKKRKAYYKKNKGKLKKYAKDYYKSNKAEISKRAKIRRKRTGTIKKVTRLKKTVARSKK
jgi:hypothetical protein